MMASQTVLNPHPNQSNKFQQENIPQLHTPET